MLKVPILDDLDYEKIFGRARNRIPQYTEEWTDLNHHDPGITVLQGMSWLTDVLNYYMDATGESHRLRYLKLLGIEPEASPAACVLSFHSGGEELALPAGTRVLAGELSFELPQGYRAAANRLEAIYGEIDGAVADLSPFAGRDGGYARLFTYDADQRTSVYFGFRRPLAGELALYIEVSSVHMRNPFAPGAAPELARLAWEYHDGQAWRTAEYVDDETGGLLASGFVRLRLPGETGTLRHPSMKPAHYLRARLVRNNYDVLPEIGLVEANCVVARQVRTVAKTLELTYEGELRIALDYCVRDTDMLMVSVEQGGSFAVWYRFTPTEDSLCSVETGAAPWERTVVFDPARELPEPGSRILVTVLDSASYDKLILGRTTGCAGQRLPVDLADLWTLRLGLFEESDGLPRFQIWESRQDIAAAGCGDRVFSYSRREGAVTFGDALAGLQPPGGRLVVALDATTSLLGGGNARRGQVSELADRFPGDIKVWNITDAAGGKSPADSNSLEAQIPQKLGRTLRAATPEDYIRLVKETPGLIVDLVNVVSAGDYDRCRGTNSGPNTVYVVVKPYSPHMIRPRLQESYRRIIARHLERYRLLTTCVQVVPACYVGITVSGRIHLRDRAVGVRERVERALNGMLDFRSTRTFGGSALYGAVFSGLEMLEGVASVAELSLGYSGTGCEKNSQGDLVISNDTLAWVEEINIDYQ